MSTTSLSRRRMLAAVAAAGGVSRLAPFLPQSLHAAEAPKRILTVFSPMGYLENSFWPTGTGTAFTLGETMTALNPFKSKLLYLDGLALYGPEWYFSNDDNEHASGGTMTFTGAKKAGFATGPSIEQAVADYQYGLAKTQYRALALGVNAGTPGPHTGVFFSKAQTPVTAQGSAQATFDMLFKGFTGPTAPPPGTPPGTTPGTPPLDTSAIDRQRKQQQSVLNLVKCDLGRIRNLAGKDDKAKVDAHMDGISSLENRLKLIGGSPQPAPTTPTSPTAPPVAAGTAGAGCAKPTLGTGASLEDRVHVQMDLIAAAFACDMTRSASLQLGICDGGIDAIPGVGQHDTTHAVADKKGQQVDLDNHKKYDRWFADRWAYLLGKLDSIKEGNGTLLDNTLIVFGSDTTTLQVMELGPHNHTRFPLWMAGGGNFAFKTGQTIKLPTPTRGPGSPADVAKWVVHQRLLTSIGQAFGMPITKFGDNDPGSGPLTQLTRV
jgi:hypothetical protein